MSRLVANIALYSLLTACGGPRIDLSAPTAPPQVLINDVPIMVTCDVQVDLSRWVAARRALTAAADTPLEAQNAAMRAAIADAISAIDTVLVPAGLGCGVKMK